MIEQKLQALSSCSSEKAIVSRTALNWMLKLVREPISLVDDASKQRKAREVLRPCLEFTKYQAFTKVLRLSANLSTSKASFASHGDSPAVVEQCWGRVSTLL